MDRPNADEPGGSSPDQDGQAAGAANKRLRIVTRCGTLEEFFATFGAFADEQSIFIVTNKPRPLGLVQPFVIQLKDGTTIMRGDVEVILSSADGRGPDGRNGMRLKLLQADDTTREIHRRLVEHSRRKPSIVPPANEPPPASVAIASEARPGLAPKPPKPPPPERPEAETTKISVATARDRGPKRDETTPAAPPASTTKLSGPGDTAKIAAPADKASSPGRPAPVSAAAARAGSDPAHEERAPGSSYQLPANPFESVTAEALESFVECTLYEERMPRTEEPIETSVVVALSALGSATGAPPPPGAGMPAVLPPHVAPLPPPPTFSAGAPPTFSGAAPPSFSGAAPPSVGAAPTGTTTSPGNVPPPGTVRDAVLLAAAIQAASVPAANQARRTWIVLAAVGSSIATLVAAYFLWGRTPDSGRPVPAASSSVAATITAVPEKTAAPVIPTTTATATAAPQPTSTMPRECRANVRSFPLGATVVWNGDVVGQTPLEEVPVSCGAARVIFQLRGFESGERSAGPVAGKPAGVFARLIPIRIPVEVTSTPPGAQILIDGHSMGTTPATVSVLGIREATFVVRLRGYKTWTRKLTAEPPKFSVQADLEKK